MAIAGVHLREVVTWEWGASQVLSVNCALPGLPCQGQAAVPEGRLLCQVNPPTLEGFPGSAGTSQKEGQDVEELGGTFYQYLL